ncbi:MAG TPA: hypothetical protein VFE62_10020 [Gemmataceae bacterium]|nr:hypothetical protein [Gemmataceae bacterium]
MLFRFWQRKKSQSPLCRRPSIKLGFEVLEDRCVPSTFDVINLNDSGAGSLRQAILSANSHAGADDIRFDTAGTIRLASALPTITGTLSLDGSTAPSFAGQPLVQIDYNHFAGLRFNAGASGSTLRSLALINGTGPGVTLDHANKVTIAGNYIGVRMDGTTAAGNTGDGIYLINSSGNTIGNSNAVESIDYANAEAVMPTVSAWQGIRAGDTPGQYLIAGTSNDNGLLFEGTMGGVGTSYLVNYPGAAATSVYGPDNLGSGNLNLVGSYRNADALSAPVTVNGFLFQGTTSDLSNPANYRQIDVPGAKYNYVHSTMGGLAVGNYDSAVDHNTLNLPLGPGHAYIYDIATSTFLTDVVYPGSKSNTAYGIWDNGDGTYTICGGYSLTGANNFDDQGRPIGQAYLVDYSTVTHQFSNWTSFSYPYGTNFVTHFEGISSVEKGVYTLNADSVQAGSADPVQGSWVTIRRNSDGSFGPATWVNLNYTGVDPQTEVSSSNSVYGNQVVGLVIGPDTFPFQATINVGFQLSNVISGNGLDGIELNHSGANQIAMNYIGTDASGTHAIGNARNGIYLHNASNANLIGGEATGGNDPTNDVFVRPPQGNLISGNGANGVFIADRSARNQLSGNYVGTDATGNAPLGNSLDGVAIQDANYNQLIGCTLLQDPFVFYNVISGNGGNGLRVTSADYTTIQANFFGMGANNNSAVGNHLDGVLVEGTSSNTTMGGPIPLGNVDAANWRNGLEVRGSASKFVTYNTFCGLAAFSDNLNFGNGLDGMLITTTGSNILIRTNVITRNGANGIEVGGNSQGVRIAGNIIGLNTDANAAMGNLGNGILVTGNASGTIIGGPQPTFNIIFHNAISANLQNGIAITGKAHNTKISYSYIGTNLPGDTAFGNGLDGIYVGPGTYGNAIGSSNPALPTIISNNGNNGIELNRTSGNSILGTIIGTDPTGTLDFGNSNNGIFINGSNNNTIGNPSAAAGMPSNVIAHNDANGIFVQSGFGNAIRTSSIFANALRGIDLGANANNHQAAPVITSVTRQPLALVVTGLLTSTPNTTFTVDLFASDTIHSGKIFLGSIKVHTNKSGLGTFTFTGPLPPLADLVITATATSPNGNTSQFSINLV